jgi:hypothetical protein
MDNNTNYTVVRNRIKSKYDYQLGVLRESLKRNVGEVDILDIEHQLELLASTKTKLDILDAVGGNLNYNQKLLFD